MLHRPILALSLTFAITSPLYASSVPLEEIDQTVKKMYAEMGKKLGEIEHNTKEYVRNAQKQKENIEETYNSAVASLMSQKVLQQTSKDQKRIALVAERFLSQVPTQIGQLTWITALRITDTQIKDLPQELACCANLETLNLSRNSFTHIPLVIAQLKKLKILNLRHNHDPDTKAPMSFGEEIIQFTSLKGLFLGGTFMNNLPPQLWDLTNLEYLDLPALPSMNFPEGLERLTRLGQIQINLRVTPGQLRLQQELMMLFIPHRKGARISIMGENLSGGLLNLVLPDEETLYKNRKRIPFWLSYEGLRKATHFDYIRHLKLRSAGIATLPEDIYRLRGLESLDVSNNELTTLPESITQIKGLKVIKANNNVLRWLPSHIGAMKGLITLNVSRNYIKVLPKSFLQLPNLKTLDLSHNKLKQIPYGLASMKGLESIGLAGNFISYLPSDFSPYAQWDDFDGMLFQGIKVRSAFSEWFWFCF